MPPRGTGRQRTDEFVEALRGAVDERAALGLPLDPEGLLDDVGLRTNTVLVRSTFQPERVHAPFPQPDGFIYPLVPPRRMTARRRDTLIAQLGAKRPETRRMAVMFLGRALDDSTALAAIRLASEGDPDPYVRGECLMCLGLAGTDVVESWS